MENEYEILPYDEAGTTYEVWYQGMPDYMGTLEECQAYVDSQ
jgi:hypothetical protein